MKNAACFVSNNDNKYGFIRIFASWHSYRWKRSLTLAENLLQTSPSHSSTTQTQQDTNSYRLVVTVHINQGEFYTRSKGAWFKPNQYFFSTHQIIILLWWGQVKIICNTMTLFNFSLFFHSPRNMTKPQAPHLQLHTTAFTHLQVVCIWTCMSKHVNAGVNHTQRWADEITSARLHLEAIWFTLCSDLNHM